MKERAVEHSCVASEALCHCYCGGFLTGKWVRICDGAEATTDDIKGIWQTNGHPNSCSVCAVCVEMGGARGVEHGRGFQYPKRRQDA